MKIKAQKDLLQKKLSNIQSLTDRGGSLQILNHFLLDANKDRPFIMATDLETSYNEPIEMEIEEEGKICIHGKKFFEIIREMEGTVSLEVIENKQLKISSGKSLFKLSCLPYEEFPRWPDLEEDIEIGLSISQLLRVIERTLYAAKDTESRFFLNGLLFRITSDGFLTVVGTDTHRLALVKALIQINRAGALEGVKDVLISKKALTDIKKILGESTEMASMTLGKNHVMFKIKEIEILTRQIEGSFPLFEQAIPTAFDKEILVNRIEFLKSLRKVSVISSERGYTIRLDIDGNSMIVSSSDPDYGEATDEIFIEHAGEPMTISFNARYLQDVANTMTAERILVKIIDPLKPVMLQEEGSDDYQCIVMPLRS